MQTGITVVAMGIGLAILSSLVLYGLCLAVRWAGIRFYGAEEWERIGQRFTDGRRT